MSDFEDDTEVPRKESKPFWRCEECVYESRVKRMPKDREAFYAKVNKIGSPKCPRCKSECFMPVGF